jgi:hypothetical protein
MRALVLTLVASLGVLFMAATPARADLRNQEWTLAASPVFFDYREFDRNDRELNHERGLLPGVQAGLRALGDKLFARVDLSLQRGVVHYDGETQGGTPVETDTETRLISASAEPGFWLDPERQRWGPFLRLGLKRWDRDIQGTGNVQGIYEVYRWKEIGAGLQHVPQRAAGEHWGHEVAVMAYGVVNGSIFVELSELRGSNLNDTRLRLGDNLGGRLRYTSTRELDHDYRLLIEPWVAAWGFDRSNTRPAGGGLVVTEPRSISLRAGVQLGLAF